MGFLFYIMGNILLQIIISHLKITIFIPKFLYLFFGTISRFHISSLGLNTSLISICPCAVLYVCILPYMCEIGVLQMKFMLIFYIWSFASDIDVCML